MTAETWINVTCPVCHKTKGQINLKSWVVGCITAWTCQHCGFVSRWGRPPGK